MNYCVLCWLSSIEDCYPRNQVLIKENIIKITMTMAIIVNGQGTPISLAWVIMNKTTIIVIMPEMVFLILPIPQLWDSAS